MEFHFVRNLAILALGQVMVIVGGVLAAGACCKWYTTFEMKPPNLTLWIAEYGFLTLIVPLTWITATMGLFTHSEKAEELVGWAWRIGVLKLLGLLLVALYGSAAAWLRLSACTLSLSE